MFEDEANSMTASQAMMGQYDKALGLAYPLRRQSRFERLVSIRNELTKKLAEVNAAIEAFESNPDLAKFIETIERAGVI